MYKKILIILGLLALQFIPLSLVRANVSLPKEYHPEYAPVVNMSDKANEADYGNYYLQLIAGGLLYLAGPIAVFIIAFIGSGLVTAGGDETKIAEAKKGLTYAVIGLLVIMLSWVLVKAAITLALGTGSPK